MSGPLRSTRLDAEAEQIGPAGDEDPVALRTTEGQIGHVHGKFDATEELALGRVAVHASTGAGPDIARRVGAKTIRDALCSDEDLAARERAVGFDAEAADMRISRRVVRDCGVGDIEPCLVGREGQPVGLLEIAGDGADRAGRRIDAIDIFVGLFSRGRESSSRDRTADR